MKMAIVKRVAQWVKVFRKNQKVPAETPLGGRPGLETQGSLAEAEAPVGLRIETE